MFDSSQTPYQGILHSTNPGATGSIPVQVSTGRLVARGEERIGSTTPMPMSARRPSTMNSFLPAEVPQNSIAIQQRLQRSELQIHKFTTPSSMSCWEIRFKNEVTTCSDFPSEALLWIKEVEMVVSVDESESSRSIEGKDFPNFEMLDARIAFALNKIIQNSRFKKKVSLEEQKDRFFRGRHRLHDLRLLSSDWLPFLIMRIYSLSVFETTMFRTSIRDGMRFYCL